jgi:hypothetical protein
MTVISPAFTWKAVADRPAATAAEANSFVVFIS